MLKSIINTLGVLAGGLLALFIGLCFMTGLDLNIRTNKIFFVTYNGLILLAVVFALLLVWLGKPESNEDA